MFWSPAQARRTSPLDLLALLIFGLLVLVVFLDMPHVLPGPQARLDLAVWLLPLYGLFSLLRMLAAYIISLAFALMVGYLAATSLLARRFILPGLDILQSICSAGRSWASRQPRCSSSSPARHGTWPSASTNR